MTQKAGKRQTVKGGVPLNRALSKLGVLSRAQATEAILARRVRVDGRVTCRPTTFVFPGRAHITLDDEPVTKAAWRTLLFHKPRGVVTSRSDPDGRPTVYDVIGPAARGLVAVGRLDFATSGLLLLTSDTHLANWLTDPANRVARLYVVIVRGRVTDSQIASLSGHVTLRKASNRESHLLVELREGRNRQVRKMFADIGHEVTSLKRVRFGPLELGALEPGEYRQILRKELANAFPEVPLREV